MIFKLSKNHVLANMTLMAILFILPCCSLSQEKANGQPRKVKPILINSESFNTYEGYIDVPEDYEKPGSKRIQLPFYVVKSSSKTPLEPIFWLDGGPGGSNILSEKKIIDVSPNKILENHDLVCIGYRGVDGSVVLKSKKVSKALKGKNHQLLSDESLDNIESKIKQYCSELTENEIDINQYNVINVVNDIDFLRQFLGYKNINLLCVSYGTRLALMYSYKFPNSLNRVLMVGACPQGRFLGTPEQVEATLNKYDSLYQSQNRPNNQGSIREAMAKAFANMPKRWSIFKLDPDKIKAGTVGALYSTGFATMAFNFYFEAAHKGDYSGLFLLQKIYDMKSENAIGDAYAKAVTADIDLSLNSKIFRENLRKTNALLGANMSLLYGGTYSAWSLKPIPKEFQQPKTSNVETLIISGDLDFRTPPNITENELIPYLPNSKHIVLKHTSHTDILRDVMGSSMFLKTFFDQGIADKTLIKEAKPVDFDQKNKISKLKIFVVGLIK